MEETFDYLVARARRNLGIREKLPVTVSTTDPPPLKRRPPREPTPRTMARIRARDVYRYPFGKPVSPPLIKSASAGE